MTEQIKKQKNKQSTILGMLTTLVMALAVIDWDNLNWNLPSTYFTILVIALPTLNGYVSTIK